MGRQTTPQATIELNIESLSSEMEEAPSLSGFYANVSTIVLIIDAAGLPVRTERFSLERDKIVATVASGPNQTFWIEAQESRGLVIYQSLPQTIDVPPGVTLSLGLKLEPAETIVPVALVDQMSPERRTTLIVNDRESSVQGLTLTIPADAVEEATVLTADEAYNPASIPPPQDQASVMVDLGPSDTSFETSATLVFPYHESHLRALNIQETSLRLQQFDTIVDEWIPLSEQTLNIETNRLTVELEELGLFVLTYGPGPSPATVVSQTEERSAPITVPLVDPPPLTTRAIAKTVPVTPSKSSIPQAVEEPGKPESAVKIEPDQEAISIPQAVEETGKLESAVKIEPVQEAVPMAQVVAEPGKPESAVKVEPVQEAIATGSEEVFPKMVQLMQHVFPAGGDFRVRVSSQRQRIASQEREEVVYKEGEELVVDIEVDTPAYVQIDYYQSDGQVLHLLPNGVSSHFVERKQTFKLGTIRPPWGADMLMVIASDTSLDVPSKGAEPAVTYIDQLSTSIPTYRARGEKVAAGYYLLRTTK